MSNVEENNDHREICKYGSLCYQKNPKHLEKYRHPYARKNDQKEEFPVVKKAKLESSTNQETSSSKDKNEIDSHGFIKKNFLIDIPQDFYDFWNFCKNLKESEPLIALADIGLLLVGPYDVLSGKLKNSNLSSDDYLKHWRYFYDPPEFLTVLADTKTGYHIGYFRDEPYSNDLIVASNNGKDCELKSLGDNLFSALKLYLEEKLKNCDPFSKLKYQKIQKLLLSKHENQSNAQNVMKKRQKKIVCKTFHKLGLVVPFDRKTEVGYRELIENDATLKKKLKFFLESDSQKDLNAAMGSIQPIITAVNLATDECDFGTAIEFGIALFCNGSKHLHNLALSFLRMGYDLLNKKEFIKIIEAHLKDRRTGNNMSVLQ